MREPAPTYTELDFDAVGRELEGHDREPAQVVLAFLRRPFADDEEPEMTRFGYASGLLKMGTEADVANAPEPPPGSVEPGEMAHLFTVGKTMLAVSSAEFRGGSYRAGVLSFQAGPIVMSINFDVEDFRGRS
ncbi:MAG: hypothetical protein QOI89_2484 [Solirubrobacteraceae bacterium]|jgi:hypothetical protein|nr:hypothetical protein [Solirubrobacteraceae bacterium]